MARNAAVAVQAAATSEARPARREPGRRYVPLLHRVVALNVLLLVTAVVVTVLVLAPGRVSSVAVDAEVLALVAAVVLVVLANVYLLRRIVGPVQALTAIARRVDLGRPGQRMPDAEPTSEAGELAATFNEMLGRLEAQRREATGRVLAAQEAERLRIAQELHDQVGQQLTAVLLGLSRAQARGPASMDLELVAVQDVVSATLEDVRRIAVELRPEALDELGLTSALAVLAQRCSERLNLTVKLALADRPPALQAETELVFYRVAQEALTNVARHAGVQAAELALGISDDRLMLTVRDHGRGLGDDARAGAGMRGMHERAALVGAELEISGADGGQGCEVRLAVALGEQR